MFDPYEFANSSGQTLHEAHSYGAHASRDPSAGAISKRQTGGGRWFNGDADTGDPSAGDANRRRKEGHWMFFELELGEVVNHIDPYSIV